MTSDDTLRKVRHVMAVGIPLDVRLQPHLTYIFIEGTVVV